MRCLKRYIARELFRDIETIITPLAAGAEGPARAA